MFMPIGDNIEHRSFPIVPTILIALNVLIFCQQWQMVHEAKGNQRIIEQKLTDHFDTWGLTPSKLEEGQVIGLLTHMFIHADLFHLAGNMIVFWAFAWSLEAALGFGTFLGFYLLWGLLSGLAQSAMVWGSDMPLIGASGAISGVMGAYMVLYGYDSKITCLFWLFFRPIKFRMPAIAFGVIWLLSQLWDAASETAEMSGVAWYAHLGGFLSGVVIMWMFRNETKRKVVHCEGGNLVLTKTEDAVESDVEVATPAKKKGEAAPWSPPQFDALSADCCPYCETALDASHTFSPGLRRCPKCERLVYDELSVARA